MKFSEEEMVCNEENRSVYGGPMVDYIYESDKTNFTRLVV